jgi:hypothetical protein
MSRIVLQARSVPNDLSLDRNDQEVDVPNLGGIDEECDMMISHGQHHVVRFYLY